MKKILVVLIIILIGAFLYFYNSGKILQKTDEFGYDRFIGSGCQIYDGCNGPIICGEAGRENTGSICMPFPGMGCYAESFARCEKQSTGRCDWTKTEELNSCVNKQEI